MARMPLVVAFAVGLVPATAALPGWSQQGPFGLRWGMSWQQAQSLPEVEVLRADEGEFFSAIVAKRVPKGLDDAYSYGLLFSNRYGLVQVQWSGALYTEDPWGEGARGRYARLKVLLEQKYGATSSREFAWPKSGWEPERFYACVADSSCGPYESVWPGPPVTVRLEIRSEGDRAGRVRLSYEHELLDVARAELGRIGGQRERDAL